MDNNYYDAMFTAIAANMEGEKPGDYIDPEDGLIHCHVCKEPKQLRLDIPEFMWDKMGKERIVPRNCECRRIQFAVEREARERAEMQMKIDRLRKKGLANSQYRSCTFDADDQSEPKVRAMCARYVDKWETVKAENGGIAFTGAPGTGKTFWAAAIANALIDKGIEVLMTTIPQLTNAMLADFGEDRDYVLGQIWRVPLLILDDVGFERNTSTAMEKAYEIVNERYKAGKPLIITTNMSKEELLNPTNMTDSRIFDRIAEMCPAIVEVHNKRRKDIAEAKRLKMRNILAGDD